MKYYIVLLLCLLFLCSGCNSSDDEKKEYHVSMAITVKEKETEEVKIHHGDIVHVTINDDIKECQVWGLPGDVMEIKENQLYINGEVCTSIDIPGHKIESAPYGYEVMIYESHYAILVSDQNKIEIIDFSSIIIDN